MQDAYHMDCPLNSAERVIMLRQIKNMMKESRSLSKDANKIANSYAEAFRKDAENVLQTCDPEKFDSQKKIFEAEERNLVARVFDSYDFERSYHIIYTDGKVVDTSDFEILKSGKIPILAGIAYARVYRKDQIYADNFGGWMHLRQDAHNKWVVEIPKIDAWKWKYDYEMLIEIRFSTSEGRSYLDRIISAHKTGDTNKLLEAVEGN